MTTTLSIEDGYAALRTGRPSAGGTGVAAAVAPRDFLLISGADATSYLQGQLSQDLSALRFMTSTWSLLLEPTGKLGFWIRVTRHAHASPEPSYVLDVETGYGPAVIERLSRFKLRADVLIETLDDWHCWVQDRSNGTVPPPAFENEDAFPQAWPGASGWDHLCQRDEPLEAVVPIEAYDALRIEAGVPKMGAEITEDVIPAELGQWLIDTSVSFTKGCYTGQELVARIDSRGGNVPRHLRGLVLEGAAVPEPGAEVAVDGEVVGAVTSAAWSPGLAAPVALAFIRRKVEPPASATIEIVGQAVPAEIRALPLVGATPD